MPEAFADTGGWASAFVGTERFHTQAAAFLGQWEKDGTRVVTTNYVLNEIVALFSSPIRLPRGRQIEIIEALLAARWIEVIHIDRAVHNQAWDLLKRRLDKNWSLVDCSSFVVMETRRIREALTPDHHFEQAGFIRLLK